MIKNYVIPCDPPAGNFVDEPLDELLAQSASFAELEDRTHEALWSLLGSIFEIAPTIEQSPARMERLIVRVADRQDVRESKQWKLQGKQVEDLLLVLLFGLERRQTRNQRLSVLRIAADREIERSRAAFIEWMRQVGGVEGARKASSTTVSSQNDLRSFAHTLKDFEPGSQGIIAPKPLTDRAFPEGLGVVLVRKAPDGATIPLGTLTNEKLVQFAARELLREFNQCERNSPKRSDGNAIDQTDGETASQFGRDFNAGLHPECFAQ